MTFAKLAGCLSLALLLTGSVFAADDAKADKGKGKKAPVVAVQLPKDIELTADQKTKLEGVNKEFAEKLAEAQKKLDSVLTDDQKKARLAAMKEVRTGDKKGKEAREAIDKAIALKDDQKKAYEEASQGLADVRLAALKKAAEFLTDDQKAKIPALSPKKGKKAAKKA